MVVVNSVSVRGHSPICAMAIPFITWKHMHCPVNYVLRSMELPQYVHRPCTTYLAPPHCAQEPAMFDRGTRGRFLRKAVARHGGGGGQYSLLETCPSPGTDHREHEVAWSARSCPPAPPPPVTRPTHPPVPRTVGRAAGGGGGIHRLFIPLLQGDDRTCWLRPVD